MDKEKKNFSYLFPVSFVFSIAVHIAFIIVVLYASNLKIDKPLVNPDYIMVETNNRINNGDEISNQRNKEEIFENNVSETEEAQEDFLDKKSTFFTFNDENVDTTLLEQLYSEQTLNVSVKYPAGWKFIDQNNKGKLDGVTFWALVGNYNPPPYIHLEVKEKYLFSKNRFKYSRKLNDFTAYYNEPEERSGQVSQEVYCRTDTENDFSIKLIMEGRDQFKSFQPKFFGMIKSFKFSKTLF